MKLLNSLMQLVIYIYYWLLFSWNDNLKYASISQRRSFNSFLLFHIFFFFHRFLFLLSLFKLSCTKKYHFYNLYCILYTLRFCYVMYYILSEMYIGGHFLVFIASPKLKNPWFPIYLHKEHQKHRTFNTVTPNATPNQIKQM